MPNAYELINDGRHLFVAYRDYGLDKVTHSSKKRGSPSHHGHNGNQLGERQLDQQRDTD